MIKSNKIIVLTTIGILIVLGSCKNKTNNATKSNHNPNTIKSITGNLLELDSLNQYLALKIQEYRIPGVSLAIINDSKVVLHKTMGHANFDTKERVADQTIFEGASISKPVFASMVILLAVQGKIDIDRPLFEYLDYKYYGIDESDDRYKKITARNVLSHTTGFPNWRETDDLPINFEPGSDFSYSGEGYIFLEKVLLSILKTDYLGLEKYFQENFANRLDMKYTRFVQDSFNRENKAHPYKDGQKLEKNLWEGHEFNSASAIHSESLDFSKWLIALMDDSIIPKHGLHQLFNEEIALNNEPFFTEYNVVGWTLGLGKYNFGQEVVYGHMGNNDGFTSLFMIDPSTKWGYVIFTNADQATDFTFDIFKYINGYN